MTLSERFVNAVVSLLLRLTCKVEVEGIGIVPLSGPAIIISNHTSILEGPLYYILLRPRRTVALAKKELWNRPLTRLAMSSWGAIPVDRDGLDMAAIRACFEVLDRGEFLCIAPEGTRSPDGSLQRAQPGTTFFASRRNVPVYPMVQWGLSSFHSNPGRFRRTEVHVRFGEPFLIGREDGGRLGQDERRKMADEMMYRLADLLPEHLRGPYADGTMRTSDFIRPCPPAGT